MFSGAFEVLWNPSSRKWRHSSPWIAQTDRSWLSMSWGALNSWLHPTLLHEQRRASCNKLRGLQNHRGSFFSARQHIYAIARPSVRPSVRLSLNGWISQRRLKLGSRNLHHRVAPDSSFLTLNFSVNSKGNIGRGAPNKREGWKIRNFQPISHSVSETVQDMTKVTIND